MPGDDERFMRLALRAALRGVGRTCPNPAVGAVVAKDGVVVATGHHARAGLPHAEVVALRRAGERARGATLYVSLEPCCHSGRTPPCTDAILAAGIVEVVYAAGDPSPHCDGKGEARRLNAPFFKRVEKGLPFVTAKWAMTLDGKTAAAGGDSRWVSSEPARALAHRLRRRAGAVLVGIGTVLADDPLLTCRLPGSRQPVRVVADAAARIPEGSKLVATAGEVPLLVAHGPAADPGRLRRLHELGARTLEIPRREDGLDLASLLRSLASGAAGLEIVDHVLLEGGGELAASAFRAGLVDRVVAIAAPKVLGGRGARTPVGGPGLEAMSEAIRLEIAAVRRIGPDLCVEAWLPSR
jgi:diaminohydroxyphosphoribosylaminopyrimidine deaminase/5-amino-6-(5-phosphoribosylamino)uracil reductase